MGPSARIAESPQAFASFPPEAQKLIRKWEIDIGFTQAMTRMALGKPDRIYRRQSPDGPLIIWAYVMNDPRATPNGPREFYGTDQWDMHTEPAYYFGVEYIRAAFKDDRIVSIDRVKKW